MRVLIIEDDRGLRDTLCKQLRIECFAVDTADNGAEGSYMARTNHYDLIILDNLLPEKRGSDVCRDIRNTGHSMPIIILSAVTDIRHKISLLHAGADDYLTKPFSFDELLARINALLRRPYKIESETLQIGELSLNALQHTALLQDKPVYFTRKEFMMLEYLMRNAGTVLSRSMIMEHVWDSFSDPFSNTIESHIMTIRKKLEDNQERRYIKTVPGRGYKIEP